MRKMNKERNSVILSTYAEIMKVCGCGVCFVGLSCPCSGSSLYSKMSINPIYINSEAEYRTDYGNHT